MLAIATPPATVYRTKRGRPRKVGVKRSTSGRTIVQPEVVDLTPMYNQPHRRGLPNPESRSAGFALGRLLQRSLISGYQYRAGERWASVVARYRRQLCAPPVSTKSGEMAERVSTGFVSYEADHHEPNPEQAERDRAELAATYKTCFDGLMELGQTFGGGRAIMNVLRKVCLEDRDASESELGDLRIALNSVGRVLFQKEDRR